MKDLLAIMCSVFTRAKWQHWGKKMAQKEKCIGVEKGVTKWGKNVAINISKNVVTQFGRNVVTNFGHNVERFCEEIWEITGAEIWKII